ASAPPAHCLQADRASSAMPVPPRHGAISLLLGALRMCAVRHVGYCVVVEAFLVQSAGELQQFRRLLAELRRRRKSLLLGEVIGEDGLPTIERAFRISRPPPPKILDHAVLITHHPTLFPT